MTEAERLAWIDEASTYGLWLLLNIEPLGSPWFVGNVGVRLMNKLTKEFGAECVFKECKEIVGREVANEHL